MSPSIMYIYTVCTFSPRGVTFWAFHFSTGGFLSHLFVGGQRLTSISTRELHCTCGLARRLMEGLNSRFPSNLFRMRREVQPPVKLHRALKVTWSFPQVQPLGLETPTLRYVRLSTARGYHQTPRCGLFHRCCRRNAMLPNLCGW